MRFLVLGPVEGQSTDSALPPMRPRHKAVLGYLLLHAGRPVSIDRLTWAMWAGCPPQTAQAQIRASISAIRAALRECGESDLLETRPAGYVMNIDQDSLDLSLFRDMTAAKADDAASAACRLTKALELWRGPAFADISAAYVDTARAQLEDERLTAFERLAETQLELGRHEDLVAGLRLALGENPLRERLWRQLMLSLYRCGRQSEALGAAREYRELLVNEQGLDPGRELMELEQAILRADPVLRYIPAATADAVVPAQLPAAPSHFTGRAAQLDLLDGLLPDYGGLGTQAVVISTIAGAGGIGKTALAVHWAHRVRARFPDGQLYINLHGYSAAPTVRPIEALTRFLLALGESAEAVPATLEDAAARYRTLLADRRMLVILDNADGVEQVRPLLPGGAGSLAVVTSRDRLAGLVALDGARRLTLDVLSAEESVALLGRILGPDRVGAEPEAAAALAAFCGYFPLAVRITATLLADHPDRSVAAHLAELRAGSRLARLDLAGDQSASIRAAFDQSYAALTPSAARVFRALSIVPGADFTAEAAAALTGFDREECELVLDRLAGAHLVERPHADRYALHDLLRDYADEMANAHDGVVARAEAKARLYAWYLNTADAAATLLYPQMLRLPVPQEEAVLTEVFAEAVHATAWLDAERANLTAAILASVQNGPAEHSWLLADTLRGYCYHNRHLETWLQTSNAGLAAAEAAGNPAAQSMLHLGLGLARMARSEFESAADHNQRAITLSQDAAWTAVEAAAYGNLGIVHWYAGRRAEAVSCLRRSLELVADSPVSFAKANALGNLGNLYEELGELDQAATHIQLALDMFAELGAESGRAHGMNNLSNVYTTLGRLEMAQAAAETAAELFRKLGDPYEAQALIQLSVIHLTAGRTLMALENVTLALDLARTGSYEHAEALALIQLGIIHARTGHEDLAIDELTQSLTWAVRTSVPVVEVQALCALAETHARLGDPIAALDFVQRSLDLAHAKDFHVHAADARLMLAAVHLARSDRSLAAEQARQSLHEYQVIGNRYGEAQTRLLLALIGGPEGEQHQAEGQAILVAIGATAPPRLP